jgi:AraC-like DNA-binding protein
VKLKYKKTEKGHNHSVSVRRELEPYLDSNWHFHEEFELIYTIKGNGIRIVGDNISNFRPKQLVLIGPWMPHVWKNADAISEENSVNSIIIKFTREFNGQDFFSIPEFSKIVDLLDTSKRGISFGRKTVQQVNELLESIAATEKAGRIIKILEVLQILSETDNYKILASEEFTLPITLYGENRLNRLINYISQNYHKQIDLDDLASEAAMTRSSVCRFFKSRTNKTIFQFINEFRVGKASQELINGNQSISEICFSTGFNSLTSFNRVFKNYKQVTPGEFKKKYQKLFISESNE